MRLKLRRIFWEDVCGLCSRPSIQFSAHFLKVKGKIESEVEAPDLGQSNPSDFACKAFETGECKIFWM
jgi:hypothetical protein